MLQALTDFADQGVILPIILIAAVAFAWTGWWRAAMAWLGVIAMILLTIAAGKLLAMVCVTALPVEWQLRSPSGHTASAAIVYGGLMALVVPSPRRDRVALACSLMFATLIGASRLALGLHTLPDVLVGGAVGVAGAFALSRAAGPRPVAPRHLRFILLAVPLGAVLFHGTHVQAEQWIGLLAHAIQPVGGCDIYRVAAIPARAIDKQNRRETNRSAAGVKQHGSRAERRPRRRRACVA